MDGGLSPKVNALATGPDGQSSRTLKLQGDLSSDRPRIVLDWPALSALVDGLADAVSADGPPDVVVGVLRGGMVPAVLLAHALGLRDVRAVDVTHTAFEGVDAAKTPRPTVRNAHSLGDLHGLDVLIVDDVAGKGETIATAADLARAAGAGSVRTAVPVVNEANWFPARADDPGTALTYIAARVRGWVIFPWE